MAELSSRMQKPASAILPKIAATIAERTSTIRKIDLSTAENWLIRPEIIQIYKEAIQKNLTPADLSYPGGFGGDPKLQEVLAGFFNKYFDPVSAVQPSHIVVTPGVSDCLSSLLFSICEPGDSILALAPYWNGFDFHFVLRPGTRIIPVHTESASPLNRPSHLLSASLVPALEKALETCGDGGRPKALVLTNPHNPFARCYPEHVLLEAIHWCGEKGLHFISDEVYALSDFSDTPRYLTNGHDSDYEALSPRSKGFSAFKDWGLRAAGFQPQPDARFVSALSLKLDAEKTPPISVIWGTSKDLGSSGLRMGVHVSRPRPSLGEVVEASGSPSSLLSTSLGLLSTPQLPSISMMLTHALLTSEKFDGLVVTNRQRLRRNHYIITSRLRQWGVPFVPATAGPYLLAHLGVNLGNATHENGIADGHSLDEGKKNGTVAKPKPVAFGDSSNAVADILRQKAMVLVSPSRSFHMRGDGAVGPDSFDGWVRITFAVPLEVLEVGLGRIGEALGFREPETIPYEYVRYSGSKGDSDAERDIPGSLHLMLLLFLVLFCIR